MTEWWGRNSHEVAVYILAGATLAVTYNITHSLIVQRTSSTAVPMLGMAKVLIVVVLSALFLGESSLFTVRRSTAPSVALETSCFVQRRSQARCGRGEASRQAPVCLSQ